MLLRRGRCRQRLLKLAVYAAPLAGATIVRVGAVAPSDQDLNCCLPLPRRFCGEGALTELVDPTITVRANGAVALAPLKVSVSPLGFVAKVSVVVLGSTRTLAVLASPLESVAVRLSSSSEGKSWSGATKLPPAVPL